MREQIIKALQKATGEKDINLDVPEREQFGDYSSNIAMTMFSQSTDNNLQTTAKNPHELAEAIVKKLSVDSSLKAVVSKIEVAGPGFVNFFLSDEALLKNLVQVGREGERFGKSDINKEVKIVVEFAHPNTHKAFHIGHLRNITTGESIVRLLEAVGTKVIRANYQGDVGLHIAKAIYGIEKIGLTNEEDVKIRAQFLGKAYATGTNAYEEDNQAKERILEINELIYSKQDTEVNELYEKTRKWSLEYFESIYKRVYTKFDRLYFESECAEEGKKIVLKALDEKIMEESEGAVVFPGSKYGLHDRVFISSKGTPTYEAKDMKLAVLQIEEFNPDQILHVVGPEQKGYFEVVFKAMELIVPQTKGKEFHIPYGWVRLKKGKMSSRLGNVVMGEDLLDEAKNKILENYDVDKLVAEDIAVGAVKYSFLKTGLEQEISFDMDESIDLQGNSGPYLQYTYARAQSVLSKVGILRQASANDKSKADRRDDKVDIILKSTLSNIKINSEERAVLRTLLYFPEVVIAAAKNYSPNLICNYVYELAQKYNTFYNKHKIIQNSKLSSQNHDSKSKNESDVKLDKVERFRLALTKSTSEVIKNALFLLGIKTPLKM